MSERNCLKFKGMIEHASPRYVNSLSDLLQFMYYYNFHELTEMWHDFNAHDQVVIS